MEFVYIYIRLNEYDFEIVKRKTVYNIQDNLTSLSTYIVCKN